jgi:hypothetical protein
MNRFVSKKLFVFSIATIAFTLNTLSEQHWVELALMYVGSQAAVDLVAKLRS